ncbi:MAG TPA: rhodanese-like domain-containing protein, partial [Polyangiaceae bacterium]
VEPEWVARHRHTITLLDVRSAAEWTGELGHIDGSILVPLDELRARAAEVAKDKPVVVTCQTGKRSAMATVILRKAGFDRVANLAGGVVRWRELGLP